jgi:hypothetical protein
LDLKNGSLESIPQIVPHAALADNFMWVNIPGMAPAEYQKYMEHVMRAQYGQITMHETAETPAETKLLNRKITIVVGSARSVIASYYRLDTTDMNIEEVVNASFSMTPSIAEDDLPAVRAALPRVDGEDDTAYAARQGLIVARSAAFTAGSGNATSTARAARESNFAPLTDAEKKWAAGVAWLATAVPMLQGVSLVMTGHHYVKQTYNIFMGAHRQCLTLGWEGLDAVVKEMGAAYFDAIFHKAAHPISPPRKEEWSRSGEMKERLFKCGHTAADVRLPAMPSEINPVKTYIAEVKMAAPHVVALGGTVDTTEGDTILSNVAKNVGRLWTEAGEKKLISDGKSWCSKVAPFVCQLVGINESVQAAAQNLGTGIQINDTLSGSHSIRKLKMAYPAQYALGVAAGNALMRHTRDNIERSGKFDIVITV